MKKSELVPTKRHPFLIGILAVGLAGALTLTAADAAAVKPLSGESAALFQKKLIEAKKKQPPPQPAGKKDKGPAEENNEVPPDTEAPKSEPAAPAETAAPDNADLAKAIMKIGNNLGVAAELYGVPVILTDLFLLRSLTTAPTITTVKGEKIAVTAMLVDKTGHIAILEPKELPEGVKPLKIGYEEIKKEEAAESPNRLISLYEIINQKVQPYDSKIEKITPRTFEFQATYKNSQWGAPVLNKQDKLIGITFIFREKRNRIIVHGLAENRMTGEVVATERTVDAVRTKCTASWVNNIEPEEFELFDLEKMRLEIQLYDRFKKIDDDCFRNINSQHYRWSLTEVNGGIHTNQFPNRYDIFATFMYCYPLIVKENFTRLMTYKPIMVFSQQDFENLQYDFHTIAYHFPHMPLKGLTRGEREEAARLFRIIQRERQERFACPKCGGLGCGKCGGVGKVPVPFYEFGIRTPIDTSVVTKPKFGTISMGMDLNVFLKMCKTNRAKFENNGGTHFFAPGVGVLDYLEAFYNLNGIFDGTIIHGGWGPYAGKARNTKVVFMARRLMFLSIEFPNDDYNYNALFQQMKAACGDPVRAWDDYVYFKHPKLDISLSKDGDRIIVRASHRVLRHTCFLVLGTLNQTLFLTPGRTRVGKICPFFP